MSAYHICVFRIVVKRTYLDFLLERRFVTAYDNRLKSHIFDTFCWWWKENII